MLIPVFLILVHVASYHLKERSIEPLNLTIGGRMVRGCPRFCDLQKTTNISE